MVKFLSTHLGTKSPLFIRLISMFQGKSIGTDYLGNRYFEGKPRKNYKYKRRWVLYADGLESSSVPPEWHGWMHHQSDDIPSKDAPSFRRKWQKPHKPNVTGSKKAWQRDPYDSNDKSYYKAWSPED